MSDATAPPPRPPNILESLQRVVELAREVLREKGLSDREIERELNVTKRRDTE